MRHTHFPHPTSYILIATYHVLRTTYYAQLTYPPPTQPRSDLANNALGDYC